MPVLRIPMRQIKEILRLKYEANLSHNKIARVCELSKGVVGKYLKLASAKGLTWQTVSELEEAELEQLLFPSAAKPTRVVMPDFFSVHQELKHKGVTLNLLWAEHVAIYKENACGYTWFCVSYREWCKAQRLSMRQVHRAGEKMFIDYCGPTMPIVDVTTGEIQNAQVFVAVLGASSYTYTEATMSQSLPDWIASHVRTFEFFGGVTELLIPDNLRSAVTKADRYSPQLNPTYAEMAAHYLTAILPARPRKPKDKSKAEVHVQIVERWIMARLRKRKFFSLAELNQAIWELLPELNERHFQGQNVSRCDLFEQLDKPALKPLPPQPYEYAEWRKAKVSIDYHISVNKKFYSVPHALVGKTLEVRLTTDVVEVLHKGKRVASHQRLKKHSFSTQAEHMPKIHRAYHDWSPEHFLRWAKKIGPNTRKVVKYQLEKRVHPEQAYRACMGILTLEKRYDRTRLENACKRAVSIGSMNSKSIISILQNGLDQEPQENDAPVQKELPLHSNVRGSDYYD